MKHIYDDSDKNKYEALDKAEVIALLQYAAEHGELPEGELDGVVLSLRNPIDNLDYKIAFCTQAKYNELENAGTLEPNCYYFITDDNELEAIYQKIANVESDLSSLEDRFDTINDQLTDLDERVDALENKELKSVTLNGTSGGIVELDVNSTYIFIVEHETFVLHVEPQEVGYLGVNLRSSASINANCSSIKYLNYYKSFESGYDSKLFLKYRNFSTGEEGTDSSTLTAKYYKL